MNAFVAYVRTSVPPRLWLAPPALLVLSYVSAPQLSPSSMVRAYEVAYLPVVFLVLGVATSRWPAWSREARRAARTSPQPLVVEFLALWVLVGASLAALWLPWSRELPAARVVLKTAELTGAWFTLVGYVLVRRYGPGPTLVVLAALAVALEVATYNRPALCPLAPALLSKICPENTWSANLRVRSLAWWAAGVLAFLNHLRWGR